MPNKEDILEKHFPTPRLEPETLSIYNAMDEWAAYKSRQGSIAFGNWLRSQTIGYITRFDIFQLYSLFEKQQTENK